MWKGKTLFLVVPDRVGSIDRFCMLLFPLASHPGNPNLFKFVAIRLVCDIDRCIYSILVSEISSCWDVLF